MIKYKIIEIHEEQNSIVVRYYTDKISEASLASLVDEDGTISRCRTDFNLDMPYPMPDATDLDKIILAAAPKIWLETLEKVLLTGPEPTLVALASEVDVVREAPPSAPITLATQKTAFIDFVKASAGTFTYQVLQGLESEYELAEKEATAYKTAGYTGPVPSSVQDEVASKAARNITITAAVACDTIVATALDWRSAQAALRRNRLTVAGAAEVAIDAAGLEAIKTGHTTFMTSLKASLGVT